MTEAEAALRSTFDLKVWSKKDTAPRGGMLTNRSTQHPPTWRRLVITGQHGDRIGPPKAAAVRACSVRRRGPLRLGSTTLDPVNAPAARCHSTKATRDASGRQPGGPILRAKHQGEWKSSDYAERPWPCRARPGLRAMTTTTSPAGDLFSLMTAGQAENCVREHARTSMAVAEIIDKHIAMHRATPPMAPAWRAAGGPARQTEVPTQAAPDHCSPRRGRGLFLGHAAMMCLAFLRRPL